MTGILSFEFQPGTGHTRINENMKILLGF